MKAISLWQPWATAIAVGVKRIETRHWRTAYTGPVLIHAAKRWTRDQREFAEAEQRAGRLPEDIPLGAIVAIATIDGCVPSEILSRQVCAVEHDYGNYESGRFGWTLRRVQRFAEPIPYRGAQGFFDVPRELIAGADLIDVSTLQGEQPK